MTLNIIKSIYCKFKSHDLQFAGSCPFTGARYEYCIRCDAMIPIDIVE